MEVEYTLSLSASVWPIALSDEAIEASGLQLLEFLSICKSNDNITCIIYMLMSVSILQIVDAVTSLQLTLSCYKIIRCCCSHNP